MKFVLLIAFCIAFCSGSMLNFHDMIKCITNENPFKFNNYGCFCGLGGSGQPVDDIDKCCQHHDKCYEHCAQKGCDPMVFASYTFDCDDKKRTAKLTKSNECSKCAFDCDSKASQCFRDNLSKLRNRTDPRVQCKTDPLRNTVTSLESTPWFPAIDGQLEKVYYSIATFFRSMSEKIVFPFK